MNKLCKQVSVVIVLAIFVTSCGSQQLMTGQQEMRNSFYAGNYQQAEQIADSLKEHEIYKEKDRVLYALETGTINYFQGDYERSIQSFTNAEDYIDQFFTKSASTGIKAFLTNDNQLDYNGEVYEDVYLNGFKSLSYLKMDDYESALVEARRIVQKLEQAESKYEGLAASYSEADTTDKDIDWNAGTSQIHNSPLGHYLASALYAKKGTNEGEDNARIQMNRLEKAITNHQALPDSRLEFDPDFKKVMNPNAYNTMLTAFCGNAPDKVENNLEIEHVDGTGLTIAIPKLEMQPSKVEYVEAVVNDTMTTHLPIIEEMDKVARETFKIKKPVIVARATVRGILKSVGQEGLSDYAEEEGSEALGDAVNFLAGQARKASERADLRGWQTMPGKVYTNVVKLPPGTHQISFNYYSADDELLYSQQRQVEVSEQERLEPIASIYSN